MISFNKEKRTFFLKTNNSSYVIKLLENGMLLHWYYGAAIAEDDVSYYNLLGDKCYSAMLSSDGFDFTKDCAPAEYPTFGDGDFRSPAFCAKNADGRSVNELLYVSHRIFNGKPALEGLPSFDVDTDHVQTLEICTRDRISGLEIWLYYSVFENEDAITRHSVIKNTTDKPATLTTAYSISVDMQESGLELVSLHGAWARERHVLRRPLQAGSLCFESRRGASAHQQNPFAAIVKSSTDEEHGEAYGFALAYSGNFKLTAEVAQHGSTRIQLGINPFDFSYLLEPNESFTTPEAVAVYSQNGLGGMSRCLHQMCRNHLGRAADCRLKRPILINSWEAMYFDMSDEKIKRFISGCAGLGIDTFVLDDGWFGHRNSDDSSLGDWFVDKNKFPNGLHGVIDTCKQNGMNFGIWFEPEMISRDSELFSAHPDWCIHVDGKEPTESRQQLVLDMARKEVVDCIFEQMSAFLDEYDISYIKWDMNRNITDNGSCSLPPERQGEHAHRYILGVYSLMDRITKKYPDILFEGCAGGGGRFDFGLLYYMPQFWTSDDTDAIERLKIQYGTSLAYPTNVMTAHVSACPNHQTGRSVPFKTRGDVAQICNFGYELDINALSDSECEQIKEQIALHKAIEPLVSNGDLYRIEDPFKTDRCCWQLVSADKKTSFAVFAAQKATPNNGGMFIKLCGLEPDTLYYVKDLGITLHGKTLMNAGLPITSQYRDFTTATFYIEAVK